MKKVLLAGLIFAAAPGWAALKRVERGAAPRGAEVQSNQPDTIPSAAPSQPGSGVTRRTPSAAPAASGSVSPGRLKRVPSRAGSTPPSSGGSGSSHDHDHYPRHNYHGDNWYRFSYHDDYFWARLYGDRWWWYDSGYSRWVYWSNGYWLWPSPNGMTYVYVNNIYQPYGYNESLQAPEQTPDYQPEPRTTRAADRTMSSPDGKLQVQLIGDRSQAFLYKNDGGKYTFLRYLADNVKDVRYSGGINNRPLRILLDYEDGTFALYDEKGEPVEVAQTGKTVQPTLPPAPAAAPR